MYLTSAAEQKRRAIQGSYNPTIGSLYKDKEVLAAVPFFGDLYETFVNAVPRPSTPTGTKYNQVSTEFWNTTSAVLGGQDPAAAVKALDDKLARLGRGGKW
jgi:trehalose/maltose transport system substrate-binding protein